MAENYTASKIRAWAIIPFSALGVVGVPDTITTILRALSTTKIPDFLVHITQTGLILDINSVTTNYSLNDIPNCTISVAIGRQASNVNVVALSHYLDEFLKYRIPIQVWTVVEQTSGAITGLKWPVENNGTPKPFMIFDGFLASVGVRKVVGNAQLSLFLQHWLADMTFSSSLSNTSAVSNPVNISFESALLPLTSARENIHRPLDAPPVQLISSFTTEVLDNDFWGFFIDEIPRLFPVGGLKEIFRALCAQDFFNWSEISRFSVCTNIPLTNRISNSASLSAVNRFEPLLSEGNAYKYGKAIKLRQDFNQLSLANRIAWQITGETITTLANVTLWDKLVGEYAQLFSLMLVPMIDRALVLPFTPGLRTTTPRRRIPSTEYDSLEINSNIPRPIRGVGLLMNHSMAAGTLQANSNANGNATAQTTGITSSGALYDTCRSGQILFKRAPAWIANSQDMYVNIPKNLAPIPSCISGPLGELAELITNTQNLPAERQLWTEYCRGLYIQEILRHRQLRVSGPLRFDICPGSTVAVEAHEEKFVAQQLSATERPFMHGMVIKVSIQIDSERGVAGTSYLVGFVRSEAENQSDDTSSATHPLWQDSSLFVGGPLSNEAAFA